MTYRRAGQRSSASDALNPRTLWRGNAPSLVRKAAQASE